jgi:uncharacterized delta-60 repeat protein
MLKMGWSYFLVWLFLTSVGIARVTFPDTSVSQKNIFKTQKVPSLPYRLRSLPSFPLTAGTAVPISDSTEPLTKSKAALDQSLSGNESKSELNGNVRESWVRQYAAKSLPSQDIANAMITDLYANVYVTGMSQSTISGTDYLTIKFNPQGDTVWTRRYNGSVNAYDEATAIGVDQFNNIYITGYCSNGNTGYDIVTIKYRSDGTLEWVRKFNSSSDGDDIPLAMVVSDDQSIYITGYSYQQDRGNDVLIIKYSGDGQELWYRLHNGSANEDDRGTAIAIDSLNGVDIVGFSTETGTGVDLLVLQYDSLGTNVWVDRYSSIGDGIDVATDIALDHAGNVNVTGYSYEGTTLYDYVTMQYTRSGSRVWVSRYDRSVNGNDIATAIDVSSDNCIYVTGSSYGGTSSDDFLTIKYDRNGSMVWKVLNNESLNRSDVATDIIVDPIDGNIFVAGWTQYLGGAWKHILTIAYNSSGTSLWMNNYDGDGAGDDYPSAFTFDRFGNLYLSGSSCGLESGSDYCIQKFIFNESGTWPSRFGFSGRNLWLSKIATDVDGNLYAAGTDSVHAVVVKIDPSGIVQWYRESNTLHTEVADLALDGASNIVVAGSTIGANANLDYFAIKYNPAGDEHWKSFYNGSANNTDQLAAMVIDHDDNIYLTGTSVGVGTKNDIVTVRLSSEGEMDWTARFNGVDNGNESAVNMVITQDNEVCVLGTGVRSGSSNDFLTIKYDSMGNEIWERYYNGPGNRSDFAKAICIDRNENVYVTGRSWGKTGSSDFATVKYSSSGTLKWIVRYEGSGNAYDDPTALTVDSDFNVYVTGSTYLAATSFDVVTIKYDSSSIQRWATIFNGLGNGTDYPAGICVDQRNNVYITGSSYGGGTSMDYITIRYSPAGSEVWLTRYNDLNNGNDYANQIKLFQEHSLFIGGTSVSIDGTQEMLIQKLSTEGETYQVWPAMYDGPGISINYTKAMVVDSDGKVVVGGTKYTLSTSEDFQLVKYGTDGSLIFDAGWADASGDENINAMVVDKENNVYVTGTLFPMFSASSYGTAKYSADGTMMWLTEFNGMEGGYNFSSSIAVDDSGNSYVTGYSYGTSSYDYATVKYDRLGNEMWVARYEGPAGGDDLAISLVADKSGNTYVTGFSYGSGSGTDITTIKYNRDGVEQWVVRYNGPTARNARGQSIIMDSTGNLIVAGWTVGADTTYDCSTIKYDANGVFLWSDDFSLGRQINDVPSALTCDILGNILVVGSSYSAVLGFHNYLILKYDRNGNRLWQAGYQGPVDGDNIARGVVADKSQNVYVTGVSIGTDGKPDYATFRLKSSGEIEWSARYSAGNNCDDQPFAIGLDRDANVFVSGTSKTADWSLMATIKYSQTSTGIDTSNATLPEAFRLSQNYPNPFNPETEITYALPQQTHVVLKLYNLLGQEVKTLVDDVQSAGTKRVHLNAHTFAAGVYFYRMTTSNGFSDTKKMVLVK